MKKIVNSIIGMSIITSSLLAGDVKIELDPIIDEFVSGNRIIIKATVEDEKGLDVVRTYFKASDVADYSFVSMNCEKFLCSATLPAPAMATKGLEYLVLVKNSENEVYKTQTITAKSIKQDGDLPSYQTTPTSNTIYVKTELTKAPNMVSGFSDSIAYDVVESSAKYGVVSGLYSSGSGAGTVASASSATGATATGTVAATSAAGISTMAVVGGVIAGGAVASGGGGGSSGSSSYTWTVTKVGHVEGTPIAGTWIGSATHCSSLTVRFVQNIHSLTGTTYDCDGYTNVSADGTISGNTVISALTSIYATYGGTVSGDTITGTYSEK